MATRLDKSSTIPNLPEVSEGLSVLRVTRVPERITKVDRPQDVVAEINRILLSIVALRGDIQTLVSAQYITSADIKELVRLTDSEVSTLNGLFAGNILSRLTALEDNVADLQSRVTALEAP